MSLRGSVWRLAASGVGGVLALGLALAPGHAQQWSGGGPSWVKLCEKGQPKGDDIPGQPLAEAEVCTTLTEQLNPGTGQLVVGITLQQVKQDGTERNVVILTVASGVATANGAALVVMPPDLWQKVQQNRKLDTADDVRLKARTFKLPFKECMPTACVAETEATPLLIDQMKANAGLLVLTVRPPGRPVAQPVTLNGFAQALAGPPTDSKRFKEARDQLMKQINARGKTQAASASAAPRVGSATGSGGAPSWVRVCDRGTIKGKMRDGSPIEKSVDMCMTTTESLNPETGKSAIVATLMDARVDGTEKQLFSVTVPRELKQAAGASIAVLPADLWQKAKRKEKLDSGDESRLAASTLELAVKFCLPVGCHAETDATPALIDMLKGGAGLRVRTVRSSGKRDSQLVSLDGFEQALSGPPTDMRAHKAAREQNVKDIVARQKEQKKREERARKKKEKEES